MEWYKTDDGKYKIESLTAATFPGALTVIREALCQDEVVCIGTEVNKNPLAAEELLELGADAALDGVSLVAVEIETGKVVSVAFNKILFMADVDSRCNLFDKSGVDCSLEIMFLATLPEHRKQKLATVSCDISIDLAKKNKDGPVAPLTVKYLGSKYAMVKPRKPIENFPKICQAIWTSEGSQRVGKALNFTVHLTVPLSEFVFNGKTYSERIGNESAFCEVAAIVL